eukprot:CAMPEP_0177769826 /NCGR_PEP_ID=MMETSP0491_2-20121128/10562_1 /TAXON_ID=63592 /ORGANISM="Tetraselmis chuii, Strain PLY429" /LENGTH=112 /DNA_ID=CAMNT_0019286927 /DNA_START=243 /DNA_END=582 /DNA_ORIENTATION=-
MAGSKKARGGAEVIQTLRPGFSGCGLSCGPPPLYLAAPHVAIVLLATRVVLPPYGRLDVRRLVGVEGAPYLSDSRLSAASSNTRVQPLIRPYPLRLHTPEDTSSIPPNGTVS